MPPLIYPIEHRLKRSLASLDRRRATLAGRQRPRVLVTICWTFPVYSHTFVYQEISQLIEAGFEVRILYSEAGAPEQLGDSFSELRRHAHRLVCHHRTARSDLAHFRAHSPDRLDAVVAGIARASKMSTQEVLESDHFLFGCSFARYAADWGADYVHSYFFYDSTLFAYIAAGLLGLPRGVSCYADHMLDDYRFKMVGTHLAQASVVVATSARIKAELAAINPEAAPRILVKPNAVDVRDWEMRRRGAVSGPVPTVLAVSRIDPKKGLEYLLQAAALLRDRGIALRVRILGAPDRNAEAAACHARIQQLIETHDLGGIVDLPGAMTRGEVRAALQAADIFAAPSVDLASGDKDGIPTALLEAMACGAPVVVSDGGSIAEVVEDGVNGLLVAQRDPAALAEAIARLLADPSLRARLGVEARATVEARYDVAVCEAAFHTALRNAVGAGPLPAAARRQAVAA